MPRRKTGDPRAPSPDRRVGIQGWCIMADMSELTPEEVEQYKRDNPLAVRFEFPSECSTSPVVTAFNGLVVQVDESEYAPAGCLRIIHGDGTRMTPGEWRSFARSVTQWLDERYPE